MSGHKKIIIGNWKMNFMVKQAVAFATKFVSKSIPEDISVGVAPNTLALNEVSGALSKSPIKIVSQNAYYEDEGAFTGEVSMPMLRGLADLVLVGHSERRHILRESNDYTREKCAAAFRSGIVPVLCVGETLVERQNYHTNQVLNDQLSVGLADLTAEEVSKMIIAYEPVWAISTTLDRRDATAHDSQEMVIFIRKVISSITSPLLAKKIRVLYGGSVNDRDAGEFLTKGGVDGLLVGKASLDSKKFLKIIDICEVSKN